MINEAALAMEYGASCEDIARVCHAHPVRTTGASCSPPAEPNPSRRATRCQRNFGRMQM